MALTTDVIVDRIEVLPDGQIQVREATVIYEDGEELTRTFHRHVVHPGMDTVNEDARVKAVAGVLHTPEVVGKYRAMLAKLRE